MIELLKLQTGLAETASHRGPKTAFIALFHFAACWRPTANIFITQLPQLMVHNYWTRNWSHIATHLVVLLVVVVLAWATLFKKSLRLRHFMYDYDETWQDCSSSTCKYTSTDRVGFSTWRHTFKMAAITSFHAESAAIWWVHTASARCIYSSICQFLIHSIFVLV